MAGRLATVPVCVPWPKPTISKLWKMPPTAVLRITATMRSRPGKPSAQTQRLLASRFTPTRRSPLRKADLFHQRRGQLAERYSDLLADVDEMILPKTMPNRIHSWHLFSVRLRLDSCKIDRAEVIQELKRAGIGSSVHWMPLHMHPY